MRAFLDSQAEADVWMQQNTDARYANHDIFLTDEDIALLRLGKILVFDGEYGVKIAWEAQEENESN